ncbi:MAG TPA: VanW family protein [Propionibacteriaceae bacterium]|nr:VanW family protein [Propionibacteriaceae bacterium]
MTTQTPRHDAGADDTLVRIPAQPAEPRPADRRRRKAPIVLAVVGTVVVILGALYAVAFLMAGDKLPRDAEISGVAVGGLGRSAAIDLLTRELGARAAAPIDVAINGEPSQVAPGEAGLSVDYAASVDAAGGGRSFDPRQIFRVLTGGSATKATVVVDETELESAVAGLAKKSDQKPKNAALAYLGTKVDQVEAEPGVTVEQQAAASAIEDAFLVATAPIELPAAVVEPEVTDDEADQVRENVAEPAVSAPIKVKAGQAGTFTISPVMIAKSLTFAAENSTLVPVLDAGKLRSNVEPAVKKVELVKPRDATVRLVNGRPQVVAAVNGTGVAADDLKKAVEPALTKKGDERTVSVELTGAKAKFSTEDARKLGIKEVTGEFTTYYPYAAYRNTNIGRAAELINDTLLKPGETFSLNGIVGERTAANGFVEGFIIQGGKFKRELGGGVSQSATTTFNAMFFAGLKDIEHKPHTLYIDRYPAGREATVAWPTLDLKFQNDSKYGVLVQAYRVKGSPGQRGSITVRMWSTKTYDKVVATKAARSNFTTGRDIEDDSPDCEPQSPVQGFDVSFDRLFYQNGSVVKREEFFWRYAPTDRVRCISD